MKLAAMLLVSLAVVAVTSIMVDAHYDAVNQRHYKLQWRQFKQQSDESSSQSDDVSYRRHYSSEQSDSDSVEVVKRRRYKLQWQQQKIQDQSDDRSDRSYHSDSSDSDSSDSDSDEHRIVFHCRNRRDGWYHHRHCHNVYFRCFRNRSFRHRCQHGYVFHHKHRRCVHKLKVRECRRHGHRYIKDIKKLY